MNGKIKLKKIDISNINIKPRQFLIKKLKTSSSHKNLINSEIHKYFDFPEKYLEPNSKIIIQNKIEIKKILPIEYLEPLETDKDKALTIKNSSRSIKKHKINKLLLNEIDAQQTTKNFELIDREKLKDIFKSFKKKSEDISNNFDSKETIKIFPRPIALNLDMQNHHLTSIKNNEEKNEALSEYLSKKSNKKESDLLLNNIQISGYKKEIFAKNKLEENLIPTNNQSYLIKWISSLRKPKKFLEKIKLYRQFGKENALYIQ